MPRGIRHLGELLLFVAITSVSLFSYFSLFSHHAFFLQRKMPSSGSLDLALRCAPLQCSENTRNCINRVFSPVVRREIEACVEPVLEASLLGYKNRCCASDMLDC